MTRAALRRLNLLGGLAAAVLGPALAGTTVIDRPGAGENRIVVSGNTAEEVRVRCRADTEAAPRGRAQAQVNSVRIDPRALQGRTVVVTGQNRQDVEVDGDCGAAGADAGTGGVNVNSVHIR